ncbi:hypothetical protein BOTBODRAFT_597528 [Botryobasidium botryosum FD-172 SS1]|uniref:Protein kinase domain-containing protein n=1 Tax=Botryobasidium botryosum (strain FD-172 SS1) TaxID=930990 RepID=A0A067LWM0_BOTB1|nr:hypothetical protein BOTBODRAFT_597528 [Botryobasidium botryosum FD-172 SS1]
MEWLRQEMELNPASRERNLARLSWLYSNTKLFPWHPEIQSYEIRKLASMSDRGGFGECYKGVFLNDQEVAMKCLRVRPQPGLNTSASLEKRMDKMIGREVHVWRNLQHPNILPLIGTCTLDSVTYMVSPWMANGNAFDYVRNNPGVDRLLLLAQAADGVKFLHDFHPTIVHGDIRGPNVLISAVGAACIADFGLSHVMEEASKFSYSTSWKNAGNFAWMAPELLGEDSLARSTETDVFAFGRMIVELTTGEQPFFYLSNLASILLAAAAGKVPKKPEPGSPAYELGDEIWALAEECYHMEPNSRPQMSTVASRIWAIRSSRRIKFASFKTNQPTPSTLPSTLSGFSAPSRPSASLDSITSEDDEASGPGNSLSDAKTDGSHGLSQSHPESPKSPRGNSPALGEDRLSGSEGEHEEDGRTGDGLDKELNSTIPDSDYDYGSAIAYSPATPRTTRRRPGRVAPNQRR